ncbi:O-antigen ligase family protein [Bradyrhizobium diazoefficiens]|nr:O-antigen ligase family protein [Bradyrhizobium diazoefficiens]MBR0772471.1 O-antigen ligase family protein [Bradyrhizobium diazoefficiens]
MLAGIAFVCSCFIFVLHEQLAERPWIAPYHAIWNKASQTLGRPINPFASVIREEPYFSLGAPVANVFALLLGLTIGADERRARTGLRVLAWAGVGYAAYGIFALVFEPTAVLWREKTAYVGSLTSTFINRNTAATYFGLCSVAWLCLLLESIRGHLLRGEIHWREIPSQLLSDTPRPLLLRFMMLLLCIAALFMTGSRGGVLISLLLLIVTFTIYFRKELSGKNLIVVVTSVSLIALALLGIVGGSVSSRIDLYGLWDTARIAAWRSTFEIIRNNVWFGTGLGTFPWVFPAYRSSSVSMWGVWDAAHSTPLELAAELGLPLAIIVSLAWIAALLILARGLRGRRELSLTPLTSLSGSLIALLHSTFDFSLQVAGFSIVIFALLGIGLSQAVQRKGRRFGKLGDIGLPPLVAQSQQGSVRPRSTGAYVRRKGTRSYLNRHDRSLSHLRIKQQQD